MSAEGRHLQCKILRAKANQCHLGRWLCHPLLRAQPLHKPAGNGDQRQGLRKEAGGISQFSDLDGSQSVSIIFTGHQGHFLIDPGFFFFHVGYKLLIFQGLF